MDLPFVNNEPVNGHELTQSFLGRSSQIWESDVQYSSGKEGSHFL